MYSKSWTNFLKAIEQGKSELALNKNEECFFRGHTHQEHMLLPGLLRDFPGRQIKSESDIWYAEYSMFYEFRARAKEVHQGNLSDWDILFYMQHHGCKTRLLDWTENFGVALYFALLGQGHHGCCPTIWLLNPYALNRSYSEGEDLFSPEFLDEWDEDEEDYLSYSDILVNRRQFWWDKPLALYPIRRVDRLTTQGGYFTIHGKDFRPLEKAIPAKKNIWKKVTLPVEAIDDARDFLEMAGINQFTMFPDLDGLAGYLNRKYFN